MATLAGDVRLDLQRSPSGLAARATCDEGTHRVVWQAGDTLEGPWRSFAVGVVEGGTATEPWNPVGESGFLRALPKPTPGFLERLGRIRQAVLGSWPDAALLEAHLLIEGWTDAYPDAVAVRGVFSSGFGTVTAVQEQPDGPVTTQFQALPWMGSQALEWPIAMELDVAESRRREEGFGTTYRTLTLRRPVYPGMTEPYWIFGTASGFVFVGSDSGSVRLGN